MTAVFIDWEGEKIEICFFGQGSFCDNQGIFGYEK